MFASAGAWIYSVRHAPCGEYRRKIGKTVGRRKIKDSLVYGLGLQKSPARIREEAGFPRFPKGVFNFRSFEEADA